MRICTIAVYFKIKLPRPAFSSLATNLPASYTQSCNKNLIASS